MESLAQGTGGDQATGGGEEKRRKRRRSRERKARSNRRAMWKTVVCFFAEMAADVMLVARKVAKRIVRADFVFQAFWQFIHLPIVPFAAQVVVVGGFYAFHVCCLAHGSLR